MNCLPNSTGGGVKMKRRLILIAFGLIVLLLAACQPETTIVPTVVVSTDSPSVTSTPLPMPTTTPFPELTVSDRYCPPDDMSTDWCICALIESGEGPMAAWKGETNEDPYQRAGIYEDRIEFMFLDDDGQPDRIEVYTWTTMLAPENISNFNVLHEDDVACVAYKPTITQELPWVTVIDYTEVE
jgi:hypothetical protein